MVVVREQEEGDGRVVSGRTWGSGGREQGAECRRRRGRERTGVTSEEVSCFAGRLALTPAEYGQITADIPSIRGRERTGERRLPGDIGSRSAAKYFSDPPRAATFNSSWPSCWDHLSQTSSMTHRRTGD